MNYFKERINVRLFKNGIKGGAFLLAVLVILLAISPIFLPKTNKDLRDKSANGILAEPANSLDVIIVGDSESYSTFIPLQLWHDYGITSYVCGTPKQTLAYSEDFLRKAFKSQKPKLVVLETNAIFRKSNLSSDILIKADETFSIYRYHDRWKKLTLADFSLNATTSCDYIENDKGYRITSVVNAANTKNYMKPTEEKEEIPLKNRTYLENIKKLCEENCAEFMLVSTPSVKCWNCKRHNAVSDYSEQYGIEYLDMNMFCKDIAIDWKHDTKDKGDHLNYTGAKKSTAYFGKYIHAKNMLADHRTDESYADWNKAYDNFLITVEKSKLSAKNHVKTKKSA